MPLDTQIALFLHGFAGKSALMDHAIVYVAQYVPYALVLLFVALVYLSKSAWKDKLELLIVAGVSTVVARFGITVLIRYFYHRPRPFEVFSFHPLVSETVRTSFPSGHATFFFALATAVYLYNRRWGVIFYLTATLIGVARVMAGVHYPSDIIGGAVIGFLVGYGVFYAAGKLLGTAVPASPKTD